MGKLILYITLLRRVSSQQLLFACTTYWGGDGGRKILHLPNRSKNSFMKGYLGISWFLFYIFWKQ